MQVTSFKTFNTQVINSASKQTGELSGFSLSLLDLPYPYHLRTLVSYVRLATYPTVFVPSLFAPYFDMTSPTSTTRTTPLAHSPLDFHRIQRKLLVWRVRRSALSLSHSSQSLVAVSWGSASAGNWHWSELYAYLLWSLPGMSE